MVVQRLEADLDVFRLEKTTKQGISCGNKQLIDGVRPDNVPAAVSIDIAMGYQRLDEMPPYELVTEQATLDDMANERCGPSEAARSVTFNHSGADVRDILC